MLDYVIVTHLPAFYKVNLYNQLAKRFNIHVIFLGSSSTIRTPDFIGTEFNFKASFLSNKPFEHKNTLGTCLKLIRLLKSLKYKKLIVGGWEHLEFWAGVLLSPTRKNILCLESGVESTFKGPRAWLKKIFLKRVSMVLASGKPQETLSKRLNFSQQVLITKGVGLFEHPPTKQQTRQFNGRFLYVGRLAPEKNLKRLIEAFRQRPQFQLTIAGQGPLVLDPPKNVTLLGHVPKEALYELYESNDVFILPSLNEPWGLVVEEALHHGLPILISNRVGAKELVAFHKAGKMFDPNNIKAILKAMDTISCQDTYQSIAVRLRADLTADRQAQQIDVYAKALA